MDLKEIDSNEQLSYEDYLNKVLSEEMILSQTNVNKMFNIIDADKDGVLSINDYKQFFDMLLYKGETLGYILFSLRQKVLIKILFQK